MYTIMTYHFDNKFCENYYYVPELKLIKRQLPFSLFTIV